jgi:DNA helicase II / ATP-dependent DNA helicase PcrA
MRSTTTSAILDGLDPQQQKVVLNTEGPLLVFAGAGSGKTRTIIHRTAYLISELGVPPWKILIVTFTNKAAKELRDRLSLNFDINLHTFWVGTFHSICARILRYESSEHLLAFTANFTIIDQDDQKSILRKLYKDLNIDKDSFPLPAVRNIISQSKNSLITPDVFFDYHPRNVYTIKIEQIYKAYQQRIRENNCLDFDDLLMETALLLKNNASIKKKYNEKFDYIMIDEYQDTNYAQFKIVYLLTGKHNNICAVGDDDQAIYSWRGASIKNILNFGTDFENATIIRLEQNYRSVQPILDLANKLIACNNNRHPKKLWTEQKEGPAPVLQLCERDSDEAGYIIKSILALFAKMTEKETSVVLYRTNAQSRIFESKCLELGIPYKVHGAIAFFQRKEVKDIVAYLRLVVNPSDAESLYRVINFPARGIGITTIGRIVGYACENHLSMMNALKKIEEIPQINRKTKVSIKIFDRLIADLAKMADNTPVTEILDFLYEELDIIDYYEKSSDVKDIARVENVREFRAAASEFADNYYRETQQKALLSDFLQNISLYTNVDTEHPGDEENKYQQRINLMTLHNAKGLEFDYVYISGLEEMLLPHQRSLNTPEEIEEERRLLYVGITRAKKMVFLSYSRYRRGFYGYDNSLPSRFIRELFPDNEGSEKHNMVRKAEYMTNTDQHQHSPLRGSSGKGSNPLRNKKPKQLYRIGQRVEHKEFGVGIILNVDGIDKDAKLTINFSSGKLKKIIGSYIQILTE